MKEATWSSDDAFNWRQFLQTETGKRLFSRLLDAMPPLLDGENVNKTLVRNGSCIGWGDAVRELHLMAYPPPEPTPRPESYPDLDDNGAWTKDHQPKQ